MLNRKQLEEKVKWSTNPTIICATQTALTLLDMLKKLEWSSIAHLDYFDRPVFGCPNCGRSAKDKKLGHYPDCELGNLLKEVEG